VVLSTHILPEVSQTCQRVVIINKGKVVAVDTPDNLTHQLKGASALYVQVGSRQDATDLLSGIAGVRAVTIADRHDEFTGYEIESESNKDIRTDVARAVVNGGLGLLELRPMRMSLEEIFLQLTTEDQPAAPAVKEAVNG
jgi:ABC-2 type transport system ATP-binding protein